jgi:hypothetical protein
MFRVVENIRQKHLDWVASILHAKNWNPHRLATEAGLSPSALNKFLKDPAGTRTLGSRSIEKIADATDMPLPRTPSALVEPPGPSYEIEQVDDADTVTLLARQGRNGVDAWLIKTRALELAGYIPGDTILVDPAAAPRHGDVVVAQVYDRNGNAETVVRIYEGSFLIAATMDPAHLSPIFINKDVLVRGVAMASIRNRRAA